MSSKNSKKHRIIAILYSEFAKIFQMWVSFSVESNSGNLIFSAIPLPIQSVDEVRFTS
ncbi:TPA: hypothetical protein JA045_05415 [Legionella pneumophila]|uniref:hypothetical protein n=1 Tax=Legionella pneumophila TaxID=446 RepID=UPI000AEF10F9|nr:hypothetical protein [Legionella pneumophila]HAT2028868.1 hypothetical protein [Legionella pneumophila]HAT5022239.1 hypothetical protein [Legionella pneumophila]HAT7852315.1 hypothetical protein [Legionella pneumophila]HBI2931475.1 hypothetical protein [Legionella pneumophila]HDO8154279.1 hypothetical protein [Legionella pneumophila]